MKADGIESRRADGTPRRGHLAPSRWPTCRNQPSRHTAPFTRGSGGTRHPINCCGRCGETGLSSCRSHRPLQPGPLEGWFCATLRRLSHPCARPVAAAHRSRRLVEIVDWLGETIRQDRLQPARRVGVDDPPENPTVHTGVAAAPVRPLSANGRTADHGPQGDVAPGPTWPATTSTAWAMPAGRQGHPHRPARRVVMDRVAWDEALGATGASTTRDPGDRRRAGAGHARDHPDPEAPRTWRARQTPRRPEGDHDFRSSRPRPTSTPVTPSASSSCAAPPAPTLSVFTRRGVPPTRAAL